MERKSIEIITTHLEGYKKERIRLKNIQYRGVDLDRALTRIDKIITSLQRDVDILKAFYSRSDEGPTFEP